MKLMLKNKTISYFAPGMAVIVSAYSFAMAWGNFVRCSICRIVVGELL